MAKVLLVEDEPIARRVLVLMISRVGHETKAVGSVEEGTQAVHTFSPDILVLDWNLPDGTGGEVADAAKTVCPSVKLVFLSAYPPGTIRDETRHLHPAAVIQKPASMHHITEAVGAP